VRAPKAALPRAEIAELLKMPAEKRTEEEKEKLIAYQRNAAPELIEQRVRLADAKKAKADFEVALPRCLVAVAEAEPHTVRILPRGDWMNESGEIVQPTLPAYLTAPRALQRTRSSADFQSAVSPISNRQGTDISR